MSDAAVAEVREDVSPLRLMFEVSRFHIISIACMACLTFGWILTGKHVVLPLVLCAVDWFIVNLVNRVADLEEDRLNGIVGTGFIAQHGRLFEWLCAALMVGSLAAVHPFYPALLPWRVAFHAIGLAYNYKLLPAPGGRTRFKETYFFKNFSSAVLFCISTLAYPLAVVGGGFDVKVLVTLLCFFIPLELTYEVIYDLRDVEGDRALKVPTFPVLHGVTASHWIIRGLLALSAASVVASALLGYIHLKEFVLVGGVIQQALYFELAIRKAPTKERCIFVTYLGAAQVLSYNVWIWAGLPTSL